MGNGWWAMSNMTHSLLPIAHILLRGSFGMSRTLSSIIWTLGSIIWRHSSIIWRHSSIIWTLSSIIWTLSSIIWRLSSIIWRLSSIIWRLSSTLSTFMLIYWVSIQQLSLLNLIFMWKRYLNQDLRNLKDFVNLHARNPLNTEGTLIKI